MREALLAHGVDLICLVGLNTPVERMREYARVARGFVYFVSVLGTTGVRESLPERIKTRLADVKKVFDLPVALGFGIKTPDQLAQFGDLIDAAVFGSALIDHLRAGGDSASFMARWA